jgi:SWI/SNF-related matrix-associated actin-dependent regulator of chromatin subfamily A member 5
MGLDFQPDELYLGYLARQELELNYPTTKGKVYSKEEDRYIVCHLHYYGMTADNVYERIKKDITEFPVFRFDWFFKSRSPWELQRRCNTSA